MGENGEIYLRNWEEVGLNSKNGIIIKPLEIIFNK